MFRRILIANRGEIAVRVIKTARRMGIETVAIYSDADRDAMHVSLADQAVRIGPAPARDSYLNIPAIVEACRISGAEAVHPGYGFLSENADFAEALEKAGIVFIGPPANAIRAMGSKSEAKALMGRAGVPLVPGYHGSDQDPAFLEREARRIGYPVLIKASAGGGGKGMRRVDDPAGFQEALASAKREAASAFGDDRVLIEKYILRPRHIEMQIFADGHGNAVHLFERDCSLQRRHQKVIEEAPAPGLSERMRAAMGKAALEAARAVGYRGAGTVEFIAETDHRHIPTNFWFMEMNTRLQVEHPVTEMITFLDLVEWQLRVAAGEELPLLQEEISCHGHAFEARLYAEDVPAGFLPSTGKLARLRFPGGGRAARIDTGVAEGDSVSIHYDPMIAKLIAWGDDREEALGQLRTLLAGVEVAGPTTNRDFLAGLAGHPDFAAGKIDTGFIPDRLDALVPKQDHLPAEVLALASLAQLEEGARGLPSVPDSPWSQADGWRLCGRATQDILFGWAGQRLAVSALKDGEGWQLTLPDGAEIAARIVSAHDGKVVAELGGRRIAAAVVALGQDREIILPQGSWRIGLADPLEPEGGGEIAGSGSLAAPMPGKLIAVEVAEGQAVKAGQTLMVLEAMKMEHRLRAPFDGIVAALHHQLGDQVEEGAILALVEEVEEGEEPGEFASSPCSAHQADPDYVWPRDASIVRNPAKE